MTAQILTFPSKAKPRAVLHVPTSNKVVGLWAEKEARRLAFAMNPCEHNRTMFNDANTRYAKACDDEKFPA